MMPNVGQGYGLAATVTMIERQSTPNGYDLSNNHQVGCCYVVGEVITSPYRIAWSENDKRQLKVLRFKKNLPGREVFSISWRIELTGR
jgi:hypothetical protein